MQLTLWPDQEAVHPRGDSKRLLRSEGLVQPEPAIIRPERCACCGEARLIPRAMNREELSQAIPPAYTAFLGQQLLAIVKQSST